MNSHYTYLLIDVGTILFPLALSFDRKVAFYRQRRALLPSMLITAAVFIGGDVLFTKWGIWWFSRKYTMSYRLLGLPVEEWLFFLVVPYACAFIAACLDAYFPPKVQADSWRSTMRLASGLIFFALLNYSRSYTVFACGGCGAALLAAYALRRKNPLFRPGRFLLAYAVCLLPFLIVNGLLTSLPVVLYNDAENIGLRLYTIPAEDIFYGMLLMLGNVWGMGWSSSRSA